MSQRTNSKYLRTEC